MIVQNLGEEREGDREDRKGQFKIKEKDGLIFQNFANFANPFAFFAVKMESSLRRTDL